MGVVAGIGVSEGLWKRLWTEGDVGTKSLFCPDSGLNTPPTHTHPYNIIIYII